MCPKVRHLQYKVRHLQYKVRRLQYKISEIQVFAGAALYLLLPENIMLSA